MVDLCCQDDGMSDQKKKTLNHNVIDGANGQT